MIRITRLSEYKEALGLERDQLRLVGCLIKTKT